MGKGTAQEPFCPLYLAINQNVFCFIRSHDSWILVLLDWGCGSQILLALLKSLGGLFTNPSSSSSFYIWNQVSSYLLDILATGRWGNRELTLSGYMLLHLADVPFDCWLVCPKLLKCNELAHDGIKQHWSLILHSFLYVCEASKHQRTRVSWEHHCLGIAIMNPWRANLRGKAWCQTQPGYQRLFPRPGQIAGGNSFQGPFLKHFAPSHIMHEILSKKQKKKKHTTPRSTGFKAKSNFHRHQACASIWPSNSPISWCGG